MSGGVMLRKPPTLAQTYGLSPLGYRTADDYYRAIWRALPADERRREGVRSAALTRQAIDEWEAAQGPCNRTPREKRHHDE